ncbi:MAG: hypothetical protein IKB61_04950 [Elusimicrobiaceae bacterium]|nr:hypothetical protein [Elusimicrobiaceae bacterium]
MNFIEKLAQAKDIKAKRDGATSSLKYWTVLLTNLTKEKTKAGLDGDFEKVNEIESLIQEAETGLQQSREDLASIPSFRPDIKKGWIEYIESYNRDFRKKRKAYEEAKRVLCTSYKELVEQQRKMLCIQKDVLSVLSDKPINGFLITQDLKELMPEAPPVELLPVPSSAFYNTYNGRPTTADAAYFCEANCMSVATLEQISNVVLSRFPSDTKLA